MEWVIALFALLVSTVSLGWQIFDKVLSRPRLIVLTSAGTVATLDGHEIYNKTVAVVSAHALNGPVGVRHLTFTLDPMPTGGWGANPVDMPGRSANVDLSIDPFTIGQGDTVTWRYHFTAPSGRSLDQPTTVTPLFTLVTGKTIAGPPTEITPDVALPQPSTPHADTRTTPQQRHAVT